MSFRVLTIGVIFLLVLICGTAVAQDDKKDLKPSSEEPLDITSKRFTAKNTASGLEATFEGNVRVRQGDMNLTCDKLTIDYEEENTNSRENSIKRGIRGLETAGKIRSITALGNVKFVQGERIAVSGKALYDNNKRTITLTKGPPKLWQGPDVVVADTIIIYLDENRTELIGGDESGIRATINPSKKKTEK